MTGWCFSRLNYGTKFNSVIRNSVAPSGCYKTNFLHILPMTRSSCAIRSDLIANNPVNNENIIKQNHKGLATLNFHPFFRNILLTVAEHHARTMVQPWMNATFWSGMTNTQTAPEGPVCGKSTSSMLYFVCCVLHFSDPIKNV